MSWSSRKKKEGIFCTAYFIQKKFFSHLCFTSVYSVLNKLSEYTYFYISKNIALCTFYLFLKPSKAFSVIFKTFWFYSESIIFYACECRGNALKNDALADKIEKFYKGILKHILGVNKKVNNTKVLSEVNQFPLIINIKTLMFKYLQRFSFNNN